MFKGTAIIAVHSLPLGAASLLEEDFKYQAQNTTTHFQGELLTAYIKLRMVQYFHGHESSE